MNLGLAYRPHIVELSIQGAIAASVVSTMAANVNRKGRVVDVMLFAAEPEVFARPRVPLTPGPLLGARGMFSIAAAVTSLTTAGLRLACCCIRQIAGHILHVALGEIPRVCLRLGIMIGGVPVLG